MTAALRVHNEGPNPEPPALTSDDATPSRTALDIIEGGELDAELERRIRQGDTARNAARDIAEEHAESHTIRFIVSELLVRRLRERQGGGDAA